MSHPQVAAHLMGSVSEGRCPEEGGPLPPQLCGVCFNGDVQVAGQRAEGTALLWPLWLVTDAFLSSWFFEFC